MGFSTWPYAPSSESVSTTYQFIEDHSDIYSEHIDSEIPWNAWINDLPLPDGFIDLIESKKTEKLPGTELTVSVSILNNARADLAPDYDGSIPDYIDLNDTHIEDAYVKHLAYITRELNPDYLLIAIEVNELLKNAPEKWDSFKLLMDNVKTRISREFPALQISESITLHNFYQPDVQIPEEYIQEVSDYANSMEFVGISFYPFFKGLNTADGFQNAFDFLHENIKRPIVFAETSHLSEDLSVESFNLFIPGNEPEQQEYLEVLALNAQEQEYGYVIWWAHRDYDELWETFPAEVRDLGELWISTGIINEDGAEKEAYTMWQTVLDVPLR
ncbi:hypothetical protein DDZ15_03420 [Rhodohalobacter mucosus]|uniref:Uncharacterized protein n=2 Tax=Rhodohalobacter mucosus TaxID=2079485 RepID=A0A316TWL1_9BACT|nr:hypothetical protein DDZ15_03420 [Rhodohalobacter mucosus]